MRSKSLPHYVLFSNEQKEVDGPFPLPSPNARPRRLQAKHRTFGGVLPPKDLDPCPDLTRSVREGSPEESPRSVPMSPFLPPFPPFNEFVEVQEDGEQARKHRALLKHVRAHTSNSTWMISSFDIDDCDPKFLRRVFRGIITDTICPFKLYQSFPTPIRALPGSRRTFVLCRFPPVEDRPRYSCLERANSLFGSFIGVILISLASPKRVGSLV